MKKTILLGMLGLLGMGSVNAQGNMLQFNGRNNVGGDYVTMNGLTSKLVASQNCMTIEFQMNALKANNNYSPRVTMFSVNPANTGTNTGVENKFMLLLGGAYSVNSGKLVVYDLTASQVMTEVGPFIGDGICHNIAMTKKNNTVTIFIDGAQVHTYQSTVSFVSTDRMSLGQEWDYNNPSDFYTGSIDNFRLWNVIHTPLQISSLNGVSLQSQSGLVCNYNFDQGIAGGTNTSINTITSTRNATTVQGTMFNFQKTGLVSNFVLAACEDHVLTFDRDQEFVRLPTSIAQELGLAGNFTIEIRITPKYPNAGVTYFGNVPWRNVFRNNTLVLFIGMENTAEAGKIGIIDGNTLQKYDVGLMFNECYHIAYVRNNGVTQVYVNGNLVIDEPVNCSLSASNFEIGSRVIFTVNSVTSIVRNFCGNVDDISFWNTPRTAAQIIEDQSRIITPNTPGLIAYYDCNQGVVGATNTQTVLIDQVTTTPTNGYLSDCINASTSIGRDNTVWNYDLCQGPTGEYQRLANDESLEISLEASIFPNPTEGVFQVKVSEDMQVGIEVLDLTGKLVYKSTVTGSETIDLSNQQSGLYLVRLFQGGEVTTRKLMIQ